MTQTPALEHAALPAARSVPLVSVIVPTFKERGNVAELVRRLEQALKGVAWEAIFVDDADVALVGAHVPGPAGRPLWPVYDCGKNAWYGVELTGADPVAKKAFNNSMGLMYDPARKLVWAVGQYSHVHVLRLDLKTARIVLLK